MSTGTLVDWGVVARALDKAGARLTAEGRDLAKEKCGGCGFIEVYRGVCEMCGAVAVAENTAPPTGEG